MSRYRRGRPLRLSRRRPEEEPGPAFHDASRRWLVGIALAATSCVSVLLLPTSSTASAVVYLSSALIALAVFLAAVVRMPAGVRGIWWCLWGFFALSALSATSTSLLSDREVGTPSSDPGPSDLLHVVSYLLAITAVVMLVRRLHPERDREVWIDSAIITFAAASIVGTFVIAPMSTASNETGLTLGLTVAYPLLDLVILSVLVWLLVGSERVNPSLALLTGSFVVYVAGVLVHDYRLSYDLGPLPFASFEALFLTTLVLMTAAVTAPGARDIANSTDRHPAGNAPTNIVTILVGTLTPPALLAIVLWSGGGATAGLLALTSVVVVALALWRLRILITTVDRERRLTQIVLDSTGDGIVGLDRDGTVMFVNLAARRLLRSRASDLVGRNFHEVAHAVRSDGAPHTWEDCPVRALVAEGGEAFLPDQTYQRRDGSTFPVEVVVAPLVIEGEAKGAVTSFRDVSERQAMDEMKRQFVSVVSHELRTPLTSIKGSLQLLDAGVMGPVTAEQQQLLTMAATNSDRLGRLIDDILDLERLDAGRMPLRPERVDGADLARRAVDGIAGAAAAAGVATSAAVADSSADVDVEVDPHRLLQVLTNLLGNAIKFSERGGAVAVTTARSGDDVRISVSDHGRGIPADQLAKVFERFGQVDAGDSRRQGGTGLGLAIAKEIVVRSGGTLAVESQPGRGSTFTVTLPAADQPAHSMEGSR